MDKKIEFQMQLAALALKTASHYIKGNRHCALMGGAIRNWSYGMMARDIDIFIPCGFGPLVAESLDERYRSEKFELASQELNIRLLGSEVRMRTKKSSNYSWTSKHVKELVDFNLQVATKLSNSDVMPHHGVGMRPDGMFQYIETVQFIEVDIEIIDSINPKELDFDYSVCYISYNPYTGVLQIPPSSYKDLLNRALKRVSSSKEEPSRRSKIAHLLSVAPSMTDSELNKKLQYIVDYLNRKIRDA